MQTRLSDRVMGALVILTAGGAEMLQWLSPTRHPHLLDVAFKVAGGIVGLFAGSLLHAGASWWRKGSSEPVKVSPGLQARPRPWWLRKVRVFRKSRFPAVNHPGTDRSAPSPVR